MALIITRRCKLTPPTRLQSSVAITLRIRQPSPQQERLKLRSELENLQALNQEYEALMANKAGTLNKETLVGGAAFLAGLSGVSAAVNEGLKLGLGAGGDVATLAVNGALGAVGIGYYFYRKSQQ